MGRIRFDYNLGEDECSDLREDGLPDPDPVGYRIHLAADPHAQTLTVVISRQEDYTEDYDYTSTFFYGYFCPVTSMPEGLKEVVPKHHGARLSLDRVRAIVKALLDAPAPIAGTPLESLFTTPGKLQ